MNASGTPLEVVIALADAYGPDILMTFSRYQIAPSGFQEGTRRTVFTVAAGEVDKTWLDDQIELLGLDEELAMHSTVRMAGLTWHVPMIDFSLACAGLDEARALIVAAVCKAIEGDETDAYAYNSGSSFHAYAAILLPEADFAAYLGELLLLDAPDTNPRIDVRWLGHALQKRPSYAALRWTAHTSRYKRMPSTSLSHVRTHPTR